MKQLRYFVGLCLYVFGIVGGCCYLAYYNKWQFAVGVAFVGWMAFGKAKDWWKELN